MNIGISVDGTLIESKGVLDSLKQQGSEIHIIADGKHITDNSLIGHYYRKHLRRWLMKNRLEANSVTYCSEKFCLRDKLLVCRKLHIDVMVENKTEDALFLAENGIKIILLAEPYNREISHPNIVSADDFGTLLETVVKCTDSENMSEGLGGQEYHVLKQKSKQLDSKKIQRGKRVYSFLYWLLSPGMWLKYRPKVKNKEAVPFQSGVIYCSNHLYSSDNYLIELALGKGHYYAGLAASEIRNTFRGKLFSWTQGAVFLDRKDKESRKKASDELACRVVYGDNAMIYPEGTRKNKTVEGEKKVILEFQKGAASIAQKTGTAILPIALHYGKRNRVMFGDLFYVMPWDDVAVMTKKLQDTIENMIHELKKMDE